MGYVRDEYCGGIRTCLSDRVANFRKDWFPQVGLACFLWVCASDDIGTWNLSSSHPLYIESDFAGTVINSLLGVKAAIERKLCS